MRDCWDPEVFARPTADVIIESIDELLNPQTKQVGNARRKYRESMMTAGSETVSSKEMTTSMNKTLF